METNPSNPSQLIDSFSESVPKPEDILKVKKSYKGYCKTYKPLKELIYGGKFDEAIQVYKTGPKSVEAENCDETRPAESLKTGVTTSGLNIRTEPNGAKISLLPQKGQVSILEDKDGWLRVRGRDISGKNVEGWVSAKYVKESTSANPGAGSRDNAMPVVNLDSKPLKVLHNMELGVLSLETGDADACRNHIQTCLNELGMEKDKGRITSFFEKGLLKTSGWLIGKPGLKPYDPVGYEKVMLLNYKALNYLLTGERKAFNVARLAIDWQNMERESFEKKMEKIRQKEEESRKKRSMEKENDLPDISEKAGALKGILPELNPRKEAGEAEPQESNVDSTGEMDGNVGKLKDLLNREYSDTHEIAMTAKSAYVNPFADYMIGAIMELEACDDPNKIDDAKKAYEKASALNPESSMLKRAAKDLQSAFNAGSMDGRGKILHVVVCDGFAPEVKVVSTVVPIPPNKLITIQLPKKEPLPNKVKTIKILTSKNKILASLDTIANMDAMSLRHQKDSEPSMLLLAGAMVFRSYAGQSAAERFLGELGPFVVGPFLDGASAPETRSWVSLPSNIKAARVYLPAGLSTVKVATYDKNGKRLAVQSIKIEKNAHNFVYGRSIGRSLSLQRAQNLWVNK
ncbi:SH3 domain-containing protein [Desulfatibacillum aliphaticivorans]|nr:SH3 domain-containing protein [Desulfatibacillum aliphaticivorans]